jgi:hypothetical protein
MQSFYQVGCRCFWSSPQPASSQRAESFNGFQLVDKNGNISKPTDYRDRDELLGTYSVLDAKGNQMHVTYASPGKRSPLEVNNV